jgi:Ohr subfamily peroxiredoxin
VQRAEVTVDVGLGKTEAGGFGLAVGIKVRLPGVDAAKAKEIVEAAHKICPYSNATRGNVPVTLDVV